MDEYVTKPKIEVWLFFISSLMTAIFTPFAALMIGKMHIKAVICLGCISLMTGSLAFIVVNQTWSFVVIQGALGSIGTAIMFLASLQLMWEWFSPKSRGLVTGLVVGFRSLSISAVLGLQILMMETKNLAPIETLSKGVSDEKVDVVAQKVAVKMILLYFVMCGL